MLIAIILIYICHYFSFPFPIIAVAWANLYWQVLRIYLKLIQLVCEENDNQ